MISSKEMKYEQDNPVPVGTVCTALHDSLPEYHIDLEFKKGEKITIVEPCNVLFFYIGRNEEGKEGVIPINYFTFETNNTPSNKPSGENVPAATGNQYVRSQGPPEVAPKPQSPAVRPRIGSTPLGPSTSNTLPTGSSLSGSFSLDDDTHQASGNGVVDDIDRRPPMPLPPEASTQVNPVVATENFKRTSGWFTPSVQQVIANKSLYSLQTLSKVRAGIYTFAHKTNTKLTYSGGSYDLLNDLASMMDNLFMKNDLHLTPLEVELRRNPSAADWIVRLKISILPDEVCLELAKAIISHDSLQPNGLNPDLQLYTKADWIKFTEWAKDH